MIILWYWDRTLLNHGFRSSTVHTNYFVFAENIPINYIVIMEFIMELLLGISQTRK